jgi:DNA-binding transcriptional MocR family regulator
MSAPSRKLVAYTLSTYFDRDGRAFPSIATLARAAGISSRTVHRALAELDRKGFVSISRRGWKSNLYAARFTSRVSQQVVTPATKPTDTSGAVSTQKKPPVLGPGQSGLSGDGVV